VLAYERLVIDPTNAGLGWALRAAAEAATRGFRSRLLKIAPKDLRAFCAEYRARAGGWREWRNEERSQSKSFSAAGVAWWTDRLGRKHVRVAGARPSNYDSDLNVFGLDERPPLALLYPGRTFLRERKGRKTLVAACACGAWGEPRTLGWMGDCCGSCHKRRQRGETIPGTDFPARTVLDCSAHFLEQLIFTPDGRTLLARPKYGDRVFIWDLVTGTSRTHSFARRNRSVDRLSGLALAPDGRTTAIALGDKGAQFWRLDSKEEGQTLQTERLLSSLAFSPDGTTVAALGSIVRIFPTDTALCLFDFTGRLVRKRAVGPALHGATQAVAFAPDGRLLAVARAGDEAVRLFDPATGKERARLSGHFSYVTTLAWSPDGAAIAAGIEEWNKASLRVWGWPGGKELFTDSDAVGGVAFSPDGRLLAAVSYDEPLRLWRVKDGKLIGRFCWHGPDMGAVAFTPDGRWLATGDHRGCIRLWPVQALAGAGASK
jgi:WD40 repeat protein